MKCLLVICVAMVFLLYNYNSNKLLNDKVESITIFAIPNERREILAIIADKNTAADIVKSINNSHREPIKFFPDYELEINYNGEIKGVSVRGKNINIDGLTYLAEEDIEAKIKRIVDDIKR